MSRFRSSFPEVLCKKVVLENLASFTGKYQSRNFIVSSPACNFIKKEALTVRMFSCEFCDIFKNTYLEHLQIDASAV